MKRLFLILTAALMACACTSSEKAALAVTGTLSGNISPPDAHLRIIAKTAGTDYAVKENVKGEVLLTNGGPFTMTKMPPGTYDLIFLLQKDSKDKYFVSRWSEVVIEAGKTTAGINYRLTPRGSPHCIDEVLVAFKNVKDETARHVIKAAGGKLKDKPLELDATVIYTVDIPDDRSVAEMIAVFKASKDVAYCEPNGIDTID